MVTKGQIMISQVNGAGVTSIYANNSNNKIQKGATQKAESIISSQGDKSKVDQIKESITSGTYKIDLQALSQKIAEELL